MSSAAANAPAVSVADAVDRLASPDALEAWSPLTGDAVLVVDLTDEGSPPRPEALRAAMDQLRRLPCPSVAIGAPTPGSAAASLAPACDLHLDRPDALPDILDAVARTPLACMALAQLLRESETRDPHEGLVAESLVYSTLQSGPEFAAWRTSHTPQPPAPPSLEPAVRCVREGDRLRLTLNRPEKHNAFSAEMRDALVEGLALALHDATIEEVVLCGEGPSFCSGGDLDEFGTLPDPATAHAIRSTRNAARDLASCADRLRAEIHGACIGAGVELPAFARHVVARDGAYFQLPELSMGLVPGAGGTVSLPRRIGRQRTAYMAFSAARIDVATAKDWGLIDAVN